MVQEGAVWAHVSASFRLLGRGRLPSSFSPTACTELGGPGGVQASMALQSCLSKNEVLVGQRSQQVTAGDVV